MPNSVMPLKRESSYKAQVPSADAAQADRAAVLSPVGSLKRGGSLAGSTDQLLQTPADLVCPITLNLFQDPVINSLGQVYERSAIQRHLIQAAVNGHPATDPVSNAVLPSMDLVPVYPMRSRAAEYRETTARTCVQVAATADCTAPVRYLRRAAELVVTESNGGGSSSSTHRKGGSSSNSSGCATPASNASPPNTSHSSGITPASAATAPSAAAPAANGSSINLNISGMSMDFARYIAAHPGSQYDTLILKYFGNELLRAGFDDAAADVFYRLLLEAEDRMQQAEYLQLCLDCWTSTDSASSSNSSSRCTAHAGPDGTAAAEAQSSGNGLAGRDQSPSSNRSSNAQTVGADTLVAQQPQSISAQQQQLPQLQLGPQAQVGAMSPGIINKLADFVQRQHCLSAGAIVRMLASMHHGLDMALPLCQVLLARASTVAAGSGASLELGLPGSWGEALEVLVAFVELGHGELQGQLQQVVSQLQTFDAVRQLQQQASYGDSLQAIGTADASSRSKVGKNTNCKQRQFGWRPKGTCRVVGKVARGAAAATFAVASLIDGNHMLLKVARVGPLLYLLNCFL